MALSTAQKFDAAQRLIKLVTGDQYGDGMTVTNLGNGYAEPGYDSDAIWVLGDWNNKTVWNNETMSHDTISNVPGRLHDALTRIGFQCEWLDEWEQCSNCYRIVRREPDSYSWTPSYVMSEIDCEITCVDCALADIDDYVAEYVNDSSRAITWADKSDLESIGFTVWENDNEHTYESGFHPHQTDNPAEIMTRINQTDSSLDVIFIITDKGQFDMRFQAMTRSSVDVD